MNLTCVLEQEEDSEQLRVTRVDKGFELVKGYRNTASFGFKNEIYAFKNDIYKRVYKYSLESGKWSLYYRKWSYFSNEWGFFLIIYFLDQCPSLLIKLQFLSDCTQSLEQLRLLAASKYTWNLSLLTWSWNRVSWIHQNCALLD